MLSLEIRVPLSCGAVPLSSLRSLWGGQRQGLRGAAWPLTFVPSSPWGHQPWPDLQVTQLCMPKAPSLSSSPTFSALGHLSASFWAAWWESLTGAPTSESRVGCPHPAHWSPEYWQFHKVSFSRMILSFIRVVKWLQQQEVKRRVKRQVRNDPQALYFNDPIWSNMWYMHCGDKNSRCRSEMNVQAAWKRGYTGKNVVVTILDDGIERNHPDLAPNYVSIRMLDGDVTDVVEAKSLGTRPNYIDIYSASWGPDDDGKTVDGPGRLARQAFEHGIRKGRQGLGSIFVWASGNGGREGDHCSCDGYTNSVYTISVSSTTENGHRPWYLEECASTLATTYSSGAFYERRIFGPSCSQSGHQGTGCASRRHLSLLHTLVNTATPQQHRGSQEGTQQEGLSSTCPTCWQTSVACGFRTEVPSPHGLAAEVSSRLLVCALPDGAPRVALAADRTGALEHCQPRGGHPGRAGLGVGVWLGPHLPTTLSACCWGCQTRGNLCP
ncbi:hypothetical protein FD755_023372 [Muntiacus reevesi]|uniref:Peptidase S8/S53 domain-containing protein n=1 Tax=Muntiacus reevesi TaxID=9886 RepID=A0A5N3VX42_MUNRE|nr:hypothetical protein FD755_023372 [Muntiacus reevesi]